ncbi:MAG TPA: hypothetical protein VM511_01275 [Luteolibacter sp.]|nr:hypothetical protein [Luteolibacter sp.]
MKRSALFFPAVVLLTVVFSSSCSTEDVQHRQDRRTDRSQGRQDRREIRTDARQERTDAWYDQVMH